jgi:hypothetical protein
MAATATNGYAPINSFHQRMAEQAVTNAGGTLTPLPFLGYQPSASSGAATMPLNYQQRNAAQLGAVPAMTPATLPGATATSGTVTASATGGTNPNPTSPAGWLTNPSATNVNISPDILNSMQQYGDAAYNQATSRLDPQWNQQKAAFDQQMVGQGLEQGSAAYDNAFRDFSNAKNDAYSGARNAAMQQGLQAQGQAFGQGLSQSQLANALASAQISANGQVGAATANASGTIGAANAHADAQRYGDELSAMLGYGNLGLGYGQLGLAQNNQDYNQMMGLYGAGNQVDRYNNALPGMQMQNIGQLLGMIPGSNAQPVDVMGAYGLNSGMQNNAYQGQLATSNANNSMLGSFASAAMNYYMMNGMGGGMTVDTGQPGASLGTMNPPPSAWQPSGGMWGG